MVYISASWEFSLRGELAGMNSENRLIWFLKYPALFGV